MKEILLTQGKAALVDDEDYEYLSQFKWCARKERDDLFYARRAVKGNVYYSMHRLILNAPKGMEVDHINGNGLDNQRSNLRLCTKSQNQHNSHIRQDNKSGFKGVHWVNKCKRWRAKITIHGTQIHLGHFRIPEQAALAYNKAAIKFHGEFARINQVEW